ncbi:MAG: putative zinc-binding protein [Promethearchaeia archaeon]
MKEKLCVLPCNGLDKILGVVAREVALKLNEMEDNIKIICPVSLNSGNEKYEEMVTNYKVIIIDGCMTRCATKLVKNIQSNIVLRVSIPEMLKKFKMKPGKDLTLTEEGEKLVEKISKYIMDELTEPKEKIEGKEREFDEINYFETVIDKYRFRVPKSGYYFNENDCWVKPVGDTALLGISDYLQNSAGDILFVDLPEKGKKIEQFDDVGNFESTKTVLQLISPASGEIININHNLNDQPELLNKDAYQKGWFAEIKLENFEEDKEFLMDGPDYFKYMKDKAEKEKNHHKKE